MFTISFSTARLRSSAFSRSVAIIQFFVRAHQKLVDVAAHTPDLADQRGYIGRRSLLDLRAVQDMTAIALTGKTGSPRFSV